MCSVVLGVSRDLPTIFTTTTVTARLQMYRRRREWTIRKIASDSRWCGQTLTTMAVLTSSLPTMGSPTIFTATTAADTLPTLPLWRAGAATQAGGDKGKPRTRLLAAQQPTVF